jgi:hypothetical protein
MVLNRQDAKVAKKDEVLISSKLGVLGVLAVNFFSCWLR